MGQFNEDKTVARLAEILALECGVHPVVAKQIHTATVFHDIGKQKIAENIINKPGKLTTEEFEIIKTHTTLGAEMLASFQGELGVMAREIALYHHEDWSGEGYWGKFADTLPFYVQIASICDVLVALINERPYKRAWPPEEALNYINSKAGTQFNPTLVKIFSPFVENDDRVRVLFETGVV